jgi:TP901 family phage tail tape measure protein
MAVQVASLFGLLALKDELTPGLESAEGGLNKFAGKLDTLGSQVTTLGANITTLAAPVAAVFAVATNQALDFDQSMKNIQSVTLKTDAEMASLRNEVLSLGAASRFGPQAAADAYYDIVGGVADASTQMAIFKTAISTAQAGNADLGATTKALISVMNSYKLGAEDSGFASDVLTQTVAKGVGTMDEFAVALPQITGLANSLGIGFDDLAGNTAYLTTQGNSASQATTQLAAMMTAMLNPNETMKAGLKELGFESGTAAISALGLTGAYSALAGTQTASTDGMAKMTGSVEALRGVTALAGPDVQGFMDTFTGGLQGATMAAEQVQMAGASAQVDLLKSSVSELGIEVGTVMIPALQDLVAAVGPVIKDVIKWVKENPELVRQIGTIATLAAAGGIAITGAGTAISAVANIVKAATTPWGALLLAITAVIAAYKEWQTFTATAQAGSNAVSAAHGGAIQSGAISQQQYEDTAFKAAVAQFGDLGARLMWDDPNMRRILMAPFLNNAPSKDQGGRNMGGQPALIGTGAQPELFWPDSAGTYIPNADKMGGSGEQITIYVTADTYEGGRNAGNGAADALMARLRSRGS